jgi:hypothetical protein
LSFFQRKAVPHLQAIGNLTIMGMKPGLTPEKKEHLLDLERSARAELKLRHKAIVYPEPTEEN